MAFETIAQLGQMPKIPLDMTLDGLAAIRQTQQADQIGLQELMRKQAYEQQMDPLRVAHQQLTNKGLTLENQKGEFELKKLGRNDRMETDLWDQTKATKLAKMLDEQGEAEANVFGQQLYARLQKTRPGTAEHKAILGALETTKGWVEKRRDAAIAEAAQKRLFEQQTNLENLRQQGRLAVANLKKDIAGTKDPKKLEELLTNYTNQALKMPPGPERDALEQDIAYTRQLMNLVRPPALMVNPGAVGGGTLLEDPSQRPLPPMPGKSKPGSSPDNPIVLR